MHNDVQLRAEQQPVLVCATQNLFAAGLFPESTHSQPKDQCDKIKDEKRLNNTAQALPKIVSADLLSASESDLTQLNEARSVWHNYRYTHRLWLCTSMLVTCASLMTQYGWGFGVLVGTMGVCTAWQGLRWLHLQPEQQASNLSPFFRVCLTMLTIACACWCSVCFGCSTQKCFSLMQVQYAMGYASAAYSVLLGLGLIFLEIVCLKEDVNCDLLSVSRSVAM